MLDDSRLLHQRASGWKQKEKTHFNFFIYAWDHSDELLHGSENIQRKKNIYLYTRDCIHVRLRGVWVHVHVHMSIHVCACGDCSRESGPPYHLRQVLSLNEPGAQ